MPGKHLSELVLTKSEGASWFENRFCSLQSHIFHGNLYSPEKQVGYYLSSTNLGQETEIGLISQHFTSLAVRRPRIIITSSLAKVLRSLFDLTVSPYYRRIASRAVTGTSVEEECLATALLWLEKCGSKLHEACQSVRRLKKLEESYAGPTRLLHLDPCRDDHFRLVSPPVGESCEYVTLSHRWGEPEPPKLQSGEQHKYSEAKLRKGSQVSDLPRAFRDAIRIVKACRLEYIWIDSLCILQDSSEGHNKDWEREAAKMGDIYAGGVL